MSIQQDYGDQRPMRGAWAPGNYLGRCTPCGRMFTGDKRALSCADCAYKDLIPGWDGDGGHVGWCNTCHGACRALPDSVELCADCNGTGRRRYPPCNVAFAEMRQEFGASFDGKERVADDEARSAMPAGSFRIGDRVRKTKGSEWQGIVVGTYRTDLTPEGYCVESESHKGSTQIYPAQALERVPDDRP